MKRSIPNNIRLTDVEAATPERLIQRFEACVKSEPTVADHRWALAQACCLQGNWTRAMQQLQAYGRLDRGQESVVHTVANLIRAERWREKVMAGEQSPAFAHDDVPAWMAGMLEALKYTAAGDLEAADHAREHALDRAPLGPVIAGSLHCEWIAESDSRFGPVFEMVFAGAYRWIALTDLSSWRIQPPSVLIDLVWSPFAATMKDGTVLHGFTPVRYPLSGTLPAEDRDILLMGRKTVWQDVGRTGVIGSGLRTWATSHGDFSLFELGECATGAVEQCGESRV